MTGGKPVIPSAMPETGTTVALAEKVAFLKRSLGCEDVIETHTAMVFLTADRAFKLKKPVHLAYLDFRKLAARAHVCREELRLNRQLAGDCYIGLVALTRGADGALALGPGGEVIDWLIEMERLPEEQMLDCRLKQRRPVTPQQITALSGQLVAFYRARRGEEHRSGVYLQHLMQESRINQRRLEEMRGHLAAPLDSALLQDSVDMIARHEDEITARDADRLVIEGHGDLRPEHVCLLEPPVVFDRIEFAPDMRLTDIFDEVGYLGLECTMLGADWIGPMVLTAMQDAGFAPPSPDLQRAYGVIRCLTRARLSIDHLREPDPRTPEKWPRQAQAYLELAAQLRGADPAT